VASRLGASRLSASDLTNLSVEAADTPMHVGALIVLESAPLVDAAGQLRLDDIRHQIQSRLGLVPRLRQIVCRPGPLAGGRLWIDDPAFRIDRHVRLVGPPSSYDQQALLRLAEDLMAPRLDRAHPMWRMWFVTGMPAGQVAVVVALHHAIADGLAAVQLLTSVLDQSATAITEPWVPATPPRWAELVTDNTQTRAAAVRRLAHGSTMARTASAVAATWRGLVRSRRAPPTSLNGPIGARRQLDVLRIDLAAAKYVAHAHGGKVNDVLLAIAAGGLRGLLRARGESTDKLQLHAAVPVSLRAPQMPADPGNQSGIIVVRIPVYEADASQRLRLICAESGLAKQGQTPAAAQGLLVWSARLGLLRWFTRHQHLTNIVESSVVGPPEPIFLLNARVLDLVPIGALAGNLAVSFLTLSYAGQLTIAVRADADRFPDLSILLEAMTHEWRALVDATDNMNQSLGRGSP
jgi:diacylglycerol O-acyltransferase